MGKLFLGFLLLLAGCGFAVSGIISILSALWISLTGTKSDWEPWFMALVGVVYFVIGGIFMLLAGVLLKDEDKQ